MQVHEVSLNSCIGGAGCVREEAAASHCVTTNIIISNSATISKHTLSTYSKAGIEISICINYLIFNKIFWNR